MAEIPINYLKYIDQDGTEKKVYPITVTDAVYDSDGNKLSNVLLGVLKDTDISNVQSDSTTTVPSSALLKATDDKIGDTSSLPGDAGNVVSAINQLNSDINSMRLQGKLIGNTQFEGQDENSIVTNGFYTIVSPSANGPFGLTAHSLIVIGNNADYTTQIAITFSTSTPRFAIRAMRDSSWSSWKESPFS